MKPSQLYVSLMAAASLAATGTIQAQSSSSDSHSSASSMSATAAGISRITKDSVKNRLTAKDLIGAAVYDRAGEKIGDIADIDLQGEVPATLASSFNAKNAGDLDTTPAMPGATARDTRSSSSPMNNDGEMNHATIFLSVGGLWGIGDDLVKVPASQLTYNLTEERFELSTNKADVVALAEQDTDDYATPGASTSPTAAGKQSFSEEAKRVQEALAADPSTSAFAYKVTVTSEGDTLEVHGMVDNKEQKKKVLDAARRATSLDVDDKLETR